MGISRELVAVCSFFFLTAVMSAQAPIERLPPSGADAPPSAAAPEPIPPQAYSPGPPSAGIGQPPGAAEALAQLTSQPAARTSFTFDRDMLQSMLGERPAGLNSVTIENYRFREPAFYVPEEFAALRAAYRSAGWKHLVNANAGPREQASPAKPITDLWLHYRGAEIDDVAVLIRAPKQMNLIEVSGMLRPLDLVHLGGHFGIPKVDPDAVMVPERPAR